MPLFSPGAASSAFDSRLSNPSSRSADSRSACRAGNRQEHGGTRAPEQRACDEERICADERRLHLPEQMEVVAAHRQNVITTPDVNLRRFVVMPLEMADCSQIYDDRPMNLRELLRIKLIEEFLQRRPHHGLRRFPSIAPS